MGVNKEILQGIAEVSEHYVDVLRIRANLAKKRAKKYPALQAYYRGQADAFYAAIRDIGSEADKARIISDNEA